MAKIKGCLNDNCVENAKKTKFKEEELYCSKCGSKLVYICPLCYGELQNKNDKICDECRKKKADKKEKSKEKRKAVIDNTVDKAVEIAKVIPPELAKKVVNKENLDKAVKVAKVVAKKVIK